MLRIPPDKVRCLTVRVHHVEVGPIGIGREHASQKGKLPGPLPAVQEAYFKEYPYLAVAPLGFGLETLTHTVRLIVSGLFDALPTLKIIVGHLGETAPFTLWRTNDILAERRPMPRSFADYYREHFWLTTSGAFSDAALTCSIAEMGVERILFSVDWPFMDNRAGRQWMDAAPVSDRDRALIFGANARKLLKL